ncbi:hypothetical protein IEO21_05560 [Rhodonia placenta]|uniref:Uncharacterized protein n=1 Tax=Rhodonia placenta TaxID=104341 RepID=A0A8H7U261_9APHY|nr:hypothetical protein IEO21_05560 [Postia placenta]
MRRRHDGQRYQLPLASSLTEAAPFTNTNMIVPQGRLHEAPHLISQSALDYVSFLREPTTPVNGTTHCCPTPSSARAAARARTRVPRSACPAAWRWGSMYALGRAHIPSCSRTNVCKLSAGGRKGGCLL